MTDHPRLIEHAFPLKQASLDSVHEKTARYGHIAALHLWPARRPLAACRAALIATLIPDPGTPEGRQKLCEKIGGKVVKKTERKKMPDGSIVEREKEETQGGVLHWGRETENAADLEWFRQEIAKAYGGRTPRILDPFAGGGAIPLEAMRLGCDTTAVDINPVAWFILKCTLEYPQQLAGKTHPLPDFILENEEFMNAFYKAHPYLVGRTKKTKKQAADEAGMFPMLLKEDSDRAPNADIAWHVRAWGQWVLDRTRRDVARYYPTYADFEPRDTRNAKPYEKRPMQLVPLKDDGTTDIDELNKDFSPEYLGDKKNLRWVAKPTVAYLWARTARCKNCRATLPLLKTRWLCKKKSGSRQRVLLEMEATSARDGVRFSIVNNVPSLGGNAAQKREHDKQLGLGTMSRSGAKCPCCGAIMTMSDLRVEGKGGRLGLQMTAVAVEGQRSKEFRLPSTDEMTAIAHADTDYLVPFDSVPFGVPEEFVVEDAKRNTWCVQYGLDQFAKLFTHRQLLSLGMIVGQVRAAERAMAELHCPDVWREAIACYLSCSLTRLIDFCNCGAQWKIDVPTINHLFVRFALPVSWDFAEGNTVGDSAGSYAMCLERIATTIDSFCRWEISAPTPHITLASSASYRPQNKLDAVVTDPPYYNAIGYAVLMDYFYVWLRRVLWGLSREFDQVFTTDLCPKWDRNADDGELVDDNSRHDGDASASKAAYERGMARVFSRCAEAMTDAGRLVVVFANKRPDAWETLVGAIIRAGFVVDGSWPIQTEQASRLRALSSSALATSVWLVCRRREHTARPGWDNQVLDDMRRNVRDHLREYWDAGIRGPDFVWAATGPAMEAYSKHPVVKKANEPGPMTVSEFLTHVRRIVVDFVVGRVLSGDKDGDADSAAADRLDEPTAYYLLHRHDFGIDDAPAGACILYAISCGISDRELAQTWDLIGFTKGKSKDDEDDEESDADAELNAEEEDSGSKVRLKTWAQRKGKSLGYEALGGKPVPLIDRIHCLMHLWKAGDLFKVDGYLDGNGLRRQELFKRLLQSLIELSPHGSEERSLLESISNHVGARGAVKDDQQTLPLEKPENEENDNG